MNTPILAAIRCSLLFLISASAYAGSAQWNLSPTSGDWNTAANWTPATVPNGPADTATFALSNTTDLSISANTEVNGITFTSAATNPYLITVNDGVTLSLSGTGITNNSGGHEMVIGFGSSISFFNRSTAGSTTIDLSGDLSSANFFDRSTAGSAVIGRNASGIVKIITFHDSATAGSATMFTGDTGILTFYDHSSASTATIFCDIYGQVEFSDVSTAGSATIHAFSGTMRFSGSSQGGTSAIGLFFGPSFGSVLDISSHSAPGVTVGSLEGEGSVSLGANNLTVGSNNFSTIFSGVIYGGVGSGSFTKIGTGTLDLTGANTYTGQTNINGGVLQVDGSISSNTFINQKSVLAGGGTVYGNVTNHSGEVSPGDPLGVPGVLTVSGNYMQTPSAGLVVQIGGTDPGQFSVLNVLGNATLNGVLDPELVNGFVPAIGQSFAILGYGSVTGSFSRIQNKVFDNGRKRWSLTYQPTGAVLTVTNNGSLTSQ